MELHHSMGCGCDTCETDHGPRPFVTNIMRAASQNPNFRTAFWTGHHLQMTFEHSALWRDWGGNARRHGSVHPRRSRNSDHTDGDL